MIIHYMPHPLHAVHRRLQRLEAVVARDHHAHERLRGICNAGGGRLLLSGSEGRKKEVKEEEGGEGGALRAARAAFSHLRIFSGAFFVKKKCQ